MAPLNPGQEPAGRVTSPYGEPIPENIKLESTAPAGDNNITDENGRMKTEFYASKAAALYANTTVEEDGKMKQKSAESASNNITDENGRMKTEYYGSKAADLYANTTVEEDGKMKIDWGHQNAIQQSMNPGFDVRNMRNSDLNLGDGAKYGEVIPGAELVSENLSFFGQINNFFFGCCVVEKPKNSAKGEEKIIFDTEGDVDEMVVGGMESEVVFLPTASFAAAHPYKKE